MSEAGLSAGAGRFQNQIGDFVGMRDHRHMARRQLDGLGAQLRMAGAADRGIAIPMTAEQ